MWHDFPCAGVEAQHPPACANLAGGAELEMRHECRYSMLILTCLWYSQEILTSEVSILYIKRMLLWLSVCFKILLCLLFGFSFPLPKHFYFYQTDVRKQEADSGKEGGE